MTGSATDYIDPILYDQLIAANREGRIDASSNRVIQCEEPYVAEWRKAAADGRPAHHVANTLSGLALSGGGIRSATFALGVTQAFAARGLMQRFDYLSTVSGGGYLGSS